MRRTLLGAFLVMSFAATAGYAAEVTREVAVNASADEVWARVGPFCSISEWYPGIDTCTEEQIDGATHRRLTAGEVEFLEKRLAKDEAGKSYSYAILEGPLPVKGYTATFGVESDGDGALVIWTSSFEPEGASEEEAIDAVGDVYDAGLAAIQAHFE